MKFKVLIGGTVGLVAALVASTGMTQAGTNNCFLTSDRASGIYTASCKSGTG